MPESIHQGDCLDWLPTLEAGSADSCVTDPPAGISFMGREWDSDRGGRRAWVAWATEVFSECLRVCKPGAHGLVWALPRTSHWTAWALEDAGWEVRDVVHHIFGTGFPKSLDVGKTIDKAAGATREVVGRDPSAYRPNAVSAHKEGQVAALGLRSEGSGLITAPATAEAAQWDGWGTALKPAVENWILVRKPLSEKTVAANVLRGGTGAINVDGCRIPGQPHAGGAHAVTLYGGDGNYEPGPNIPGNPSGRWPANLVLDEEAARALDEVVGERKTGHLTRKRQAVGWHGTKDWEPCNYGGDTGGPSRFFYCAKASRREREAGCEGLEARSPAFGAAVGDGLGRGISNTRQDTRHGNHHPTVKPLALMRWLCRLVTPPGGTVLDPFAGSGSTLIAAGQEGFRYLGCEKDEEYVRIAEARLAHWMEQPVLMEAAG